jgi:UDP-N-acetylmuramoyl-tripeptide--D-alanyl-D-alanine ligase
MMASDYLYKIFRTPFQLKEWGLFFTFVLMNSVIEKLYKTYRDFPDVTTDSRLVNPGSIFFALKGESFNGNEYAAEAIKKGARLAVVDELKGDPGKNILVVENVLDSLQRIAKLHRQKLGLKIIAITGTNGKTTTKELMHRVLKKKYKVGATAGNLNNHIGVPLTILSFKPGLEFGIVEMGANHIGEITRLCDIARPDFGIITNVGKAHLEGFGNLEGVIKAKTELYNFLRKNDGIVFVNTQNEILLKASVGIKSSGYSSGEGADYSGKIVRDFPYLTLDCNLANHILKIESKLIGSYNFENILAAVAIGNYFDVSPEDIKEAIESYEPANNRSQIISTASNTLILDAYNANPSSMKVAIENFAKAEFSNKVLILGDMFELGNESETEHNAILDLIRYFGFKKIFLVGRAFHNAYNSKEFQSFPTVIQLQEFLKEHPLTESTVLIKGSRKMQLERLTPGL